MLVELAQTLSGPEIEHGRSVILTTRVHVVGHPFLVALTVRVYEPEAPATTLTDDPLVGPEIVPLPEMLHE